MILWTDYMRYRARLRGFDLTKVEEIVRYSAERYEDRATGRLVVVGKHDRTIVLIPVDTQDADLVPVTVHRTTREQVKARLKSGRYSHV